MRILLKILEPLYPLLQRYQEERVKTCESDQEQSSGTGDRHCIKKSELSDEQEGGVSDCGVGAGDGISAEGDGDVASGDSVDDKAKTEGKKSIEDEDEFKQLMTLYEILAAFIKDYCSLLISVSIISSEF